MGSAQSHTVSMRISATILSVCRIAAGNIDDRAGTPAAPSIQARCNTPHTAPPPRQVWEPAPASATATRTAAGEQSPRETPHTVSSSGGMLTFYY